MNVRKTYMMAFVVGLIQTVNVSIAAEHDRTAFEKALTAKYALITRAYESHDASILRNFYSNDVIVLGENQKAIQGIEPLIAAWAGILPSRKTAQVLSKRSYMSADGTTGYDIGILHAEKIASGAPAVDETILTVWKRFGADWRCVSEMFVSGDQFGGDRP